MKLDKIILKNFRGYKEEIKIPISNLTAFIGKNDAGKSSVLEALEIFFNNKLVICEREDSNVNSDDNEIQISCIFSDLPNEIIIDTTAPTSLENEYLLNSDGKLHIKKMFSTTAAKPKEKIYIVCNHPTIQNGKDLLRLKRSELKARADNLGINEADYNSNINSSIRGAIWNSFECLDITNSEILVDKEDTKKVYESLKNFLPLYALFQSNRQSKDDDKEVSDPMKIAIQQALSDLNAELEYIKTKVQNRATATARRTLDKLKEMAPDLASVLKPQFKTEPKFDSQFKLTISSDDNIPINKRGSGVRRLVLLNFFRAEADRLRNQYSGRKVIYAFEEPETSQHPDHQKMLIEAFKEISNSGNSQVLLTTHTPTLGGLLSLDSLRFIEKNGNTRTMELGTDQVFEKIADALGVLPEPIAKNATAILLLEGKGDVTFIRHMASQLKEGGFINHTLEEKRIALVPIGGCGNLKHWTTLRLADQFNIPYCVLQDSDKGTPEEAKNIAKIQELKNSGVKAYLTRKREPENYILLECLNLPSGSTFNFTDTCNAKSLIAQEKFSSSRTVLENYWTNMDIQQIREVERYQENGVDRYEFTEMLNDFLSLVN
ncbi:MAG: AAA family ATPase [Flavobacteriaceae bacterium]|nr:MAG: AAA family ATPase [Flavobacteriaceae bacterium]